MANNVKVRQLESQIQMKLSEIISRLGNKISTQTSVTEVVLSNDHSHAKVYVTFMGGNKKSQFNELEKSNSFIRRELASSLNIKKTPVLDFIIDDTLDKIKELDDLLDKTKK